MEISDSCVFTQYLVGGNEVRITLIDLGAYIGLMVIGVKTMVSVATGGQLRQSTTQLVLLVLYLMLRWDC